MSAIAGIIYFDGRPQAQDDLVRMMRPLATLGPEHEANWHDAGVALGFRQMVFLPEDRFDRQPWVGASGLVMVGVTRLDNRDDLYESLAIAPPERAALADNELIFRAYERWGPSALDRLVGDFVVAIWDQRQRRLFCARSHIAGPSIYYHRAERFFAFATTAEALLALPDVPCVLNERHAARHIMLLPWQTDETFYRDVFRLLPGHSLTVVKDRVEVKRYWRLNIRRRIELASDGDYVAAFKEKFDRAVSACLRSVHPVGSHLSSGRDSSAVTVTAARLLGTSGGRLAAFTAAPREGYSDPGLAGLTVDESAIAATIVAGLPNVSHVVVRSDGRSLLDSFTHAYDLYGRPLRNPAIVPWFEQINDEARRLGARVLLTGDLGNASISYAGPAVQAMLLRSGQWGALARLCAAMRSEGRGWRQILAPAVGPLLPQWLWRFYETRWRRGEGMGAADSAINPSFAAGIAPSLAASSRGWDTRFRPWADGRVLRRAGIEREDGADYASGVLAGWGIDIRDPTADRRLVEFCTAIPDDQYRRDGHTHHLYRAAFATELPDAVRLGEKRTYQGADWHESLTAARADIAAEIARLENSPLASRVLDLPRLRRMVEDWPERGWDADKIVRDYRLTLVRGLAAGNFIRRVEARN